MASKSVTGSNGHHAFTMTVTERSGSASVANNTSIVDFSIVLSPVQTGWDWAFSNSDPFTLTYTINGVSGTCTLRTYNGTSTVTIKSGSQTITHDANGSKTISWSFSFTSQNYSYLPGSGSSGAQSLTLATIPRNPTCTQSLTSKTETTMTVSWTASMTCAKLWYSTDGGAHWYPSGGMSINASSGTYTITGLSAGTTYTVQTSVRAKDTGLDGYSSTSSWTTYPYPSCTAAPDFTIGNVLTVTLNNPLGRTVTVSMTVGGQDKTLGTFSQKKASGFNSAEWVDWLYARIPSATKGRYSIKVTYSGHTSTKLGGYCSIVPSECAPTAGALTYEDTNIAAVHITGDNQKIIQLMSTVQFTVPDVQAKNHASISFVSVQINGVGYALSRVGTSNVYQATDITLNYTSDVEAQLVVADSRGLAMAASPITITMIPYSTPTAIVTLQRRFNYYSETYLTVDASYSSLNGGNHITIKYRYKQSGGLWSGYATINNRHQYTESFDNLYDWTIQVVIEDDLGATVTYNVPLSKGMPIVFFDALRSSMSVNCFPQTDDSLWVNGAEFIPQNYGYHDFDLGSGAQTVSSARYVQLLSSSDTSPYLPSGCVWVHAEPIRWNTATGVFNINIYGDGSVYLIAENTKGVSNLKIRCFFAKCVEV